LGQGRGRMISTPDRMMAVELIDQAVVAGARREQACAELGIHDRTYRRWTAGYGVAGDRRPEAVREEPVNKLTESERNEILDTCHQKEYASLPPSQIVPRLADEGTYLASESSFYRVLHAAEEQQHRGRARAPRTTRRPSTHCALAPCELWSWDVSFLRSPVRGLFYYLYMILDVYSRKIVGWEIYDQETGEYASALIHRAVLAEGCIDQPLILHADNGAIQKGYTLRTKLEQLGIEASYSRPRVSDDNPYSESLFRTCKYRPDFPVDGFASIEAAREWMKQFVHWYNEVHRHSGIRYVTPGQRHRGEDVGILAKRNDTYSAAKERNPQRWSGDTRNWSPVNEVWLNPEKSAEKTDETILEVA